MDEAVAAHLRHDDRMWQRVAKEVDRHVDLLAHDAAHAVRGEYPVVEGSRVLAQGPHLARALGYEDVDAGAQLVPRLRFQQVNVDDVEVAVDAAGLDVQG